MEGAILKIKLDRINECAASATHDDLVRNLLHGYVSCLSVEELCDAALRTINASAEVRGAIATRVFRLWREGRGISSFDALAHRFLELRPADAKTRLRVDALLSRLYLIFAPPTRQAIFDRWTAHGTVGASGRWLKALASDELLFRADIVLKYWRTSRDWRAAKLIAYYADPALLTEILPELLQTCE
jgi:hypothetical protein